MKIEKLLTLSQFVDQNCNDIEDLPFPSAIVDSVRNYNNFLKIPLTKDMFILNQPFELDSEHLNSPNSWSKDEIDEWQEAEKKVIFKHPKEQGNVDIIILAAKTIGGYANAMDGEIELSNVEI